MQDLAQIRQDYSLKSLDESDVLPNPFEQFGLWLNEAIQARLPEPTAMHLATVSATGKPSGRIVLLKGVEADCFLFFTNYQSRKGQEIAQNSDVAITFYWAELERQVRAEGKVSFLNEEVSEVYFHSRPRLSQIGAVASPQSQIIANRAFLELKFETLQNEYGETQEIPKPAHWGGYQVRIEYFEFWQGRRSRLHDRIIYQKEGESWQTARLAP
jgi:pyridoxamine-phosphate oxidase